MKSLRQFVPVAVFVALGLAVAQTPSSPSSSAFDKLKLLAGEWEGTAKGEGKEFPATTSFRLISDNSVLMNVLGQGTPHEMVTMFHMDNDDLLATHYCAEHNQPRLRFVAKSDPKVFAFEFKDATNLSSPSALHMTAVKLTVADPNHHIEEWTSTENGQTTTMRFDFHRKM